MIYIVRQKHHPFYSCQSCLNSLINLVGKTTESVADDFRKSYRELFKALFTEFRHKTDKSKLMENVLDNCGKYF